MSFVLLMCGCGFVHRVLMFAFLAGLAKFCASVDLTAANCFYRCGYCCSFVAALCVYGRQLLLGARNTSTEH